MVILIRECKLFNVMLYKYVYAERNIEIHVFHAIYVLIFFSFSASPLSLSLITLYKFSRTFSYFIETITWI